MTLPTFCLLFVCAHTAIRQTRTSKVVRLERTYRVGSTDGEPDYESGGQEFESLRARHLVLICEPDSTACPARTARSPAGQNDDGQHIIGNHNAQSVQVRSHRLSR